MSKKQKAKNRELIRTVGERLVQGLTERLNDAGLPHRIFSKQARTGSLYVKIKTEQKHAGAAVRISDHRKKPSDRWVNFSRPAKRFYGVWCFNNMAGIDGKAQRIAANIVRLNKIGGEA